MAIYTRVIRLSPPAPLPSPLPSLLSPPAAAALLSLLAPLSCRCSLLSPVVSGCSFLFSFFPSILSLPLLSSLIPSLHLLSTPPSLSSPSPLSSRAVEVWAASLPPRCPAPRSVLCIQASQDGGMGEWAGGLAESRGGVAERRGGEQGGEEG